MAMSLNDRIRMWKLLRQSYKPCDRPDPGTMAIFFDEHQMMVYAGVVLNWPLITFADSESDALNQKDALSVPFAGTKVRFFSRIAADESKPVEEPQPIAAVTG
jgi:hypothetical protein